MATDFLVSLFAAPETERRGMLREYVLSELRRALLMQPGENVPLKASLFDLGLSSLDLEGLKQQLEKTLDCAINSSEMYSNPTAGHLLAHFERRLFGSTDIAATGGETDGGETDDKTLVDQILASLYATAASTP